MTFEDLLIEIEKLNGLELDSIARAEGIKIIKVNRSTKRIELITTGSGKELSRTFDEIKKIWDRLCKEPAVHVDSVLSGSSSSRSQPETIFANLPNVEWLRFNSKKHLTLLSEPTHDYGTLKKMDDIDAEKIKEKLRDSAAVTSEILVVSDGLKTASEVFESATGLKLEPVEAGIYRKVKDGTCYWVTSIDQVTGHIEPGTYPIVKGISKPQTGRIAFNGQEYFLVQGGGLKVLTYIE
ncbi:hypothetical protein [Paenibacillus rhizophilus]|uniref:Uncharacterized protein n=1 Tax=Paenibacillus rhizophilus TaxID=1850366 RepID=A0A3N9PR94_9BACL|nr:hypothetical protein [Paenibacillus rhizophilus]RQW08832.1 hypothetical protein EH198_20790 [Paenibacillus rhizophilus]